MKRLHLGGVLILGALATALPVGCSGNKDGGPEPDPPVGVERPAKADQANDADVRAVARGNNAFAFELHRKLPGQDNLFFSPFSVSTALSMTYAGAKGETAAEMARALRYPFEGERLHLGYAGLLGKLSGDARPAGVRLNVANALWGPEDYNKPFLDINRDCYAAHVRKIRLPGAEPVINKWAEDHTEGRIKDLLPPGSLDDTAVLVLTNAVYFKGEWKYRFKESATLDQPFRVPGRSAVKVPMMQQTEKLRYTHTDRGEPAAAQVLELPYKSGDLSMVIILPDADDGIKMVERTLTAEKLEGWLSRMDEQEVRVSLPRFKLQGKSVSLKGALVELDMVRAFGPGGDFSGMCSGDVHIGEVLHQAFVEVNEEGSEAAAATAVDKKVDSKEELVTFTADHPFLFLIRDNRTGCILFQGRLSSPK